MRFLFLLVFLPLFSFAQSNPEMLIGKWVKVKAEMKDGSRIVDHNGCGMDFLKYNFIDANTVDMSSDVLFDGFKMPYKLKGDSLIVGGTIYNVIGFTKDTLKVSYFVLGAEDSQLPLLYFTRPQEHNVAAKATFDASLKDSVYQATNQLFPQCKGGILSLMQAIDARYDKGTIKASFIIDKKGRVKSYTTIAIDSVSNGFAKIVGRGFGALEWLPARKNNIPVNSIVQLIIKTEQKPYSGQMMNTLKIEYTFLPKDAYEALDPDEATEERRLFNIALNQANSQNLEKALELLNKCIEIDKIDLNAYNLRAIVNTGLNRPKDACKDWAILAGFGQVSAAKKLAKFCKN
jgi:hypothetical protein